METHHQTIKAELYPNPLKNNEGTFKAQTITYQTLGIRDICNSLCNKPGTGIDPDTLEYHVRLFLEEMGELLTNGYAVNTGYFTACATIKGSFNSKNENFEHEKHGVTFKFTQGALLRKKAEETRAEILHVESANYGIQNVMDTYSGSENDRITPGNILHLTGLKLKLTGNHPDVGIYFINETTAERTKVPTVNIVMNQNNRLMVLIPGLQPGSYRLEHITQYAGSGITLTEPHTSSFIRILRVL